MNYQKEFSEISFISTIALGFSLLIAVLTWL